MSTQTAFWPEIRRAVLQWAGVVLAAIISGLLRGGLLHSGMSEKHALEIALPVGFLVALLCWVLVAFWFLLKSRATLSMPVSAPTVPNFEGQLTTAYSYSFEMAAPPTIAYQAPAA